jgi:hypothetical protein
MNKKAKSIKVLNYKDDLLLDNLDKFLKEVKEEDIYWDESENIKKLMQNHN